jgi:type IV secretion system protein VirB10
MSIRPVLVTTFVVAGLLSAQEAAPEPPDFTVQTGTKVPLSLINSISTKHSAEGDRVYLETVFPVLVNGRIVVPVGSYVAGTVTQLKKPGRVKGRGELYVRFDSLTLPNGVTRDFHGRIGSMDGNAKDELDRAEGKVKSEGNKSGDAKTVGEAAAAGASIGTLAGGAAGHYGMGAGIGAAAGAAAGMIGVLSSRGPDAVLARGSTLEMVLDRPISKRPESFLSAEQATDHPIAQQLFAIDGVKSVLLLGDFVTINKDAAAAWPTIKRRVKQVLSKV